MDEREATTKLLALLGLAQRAGQLAVGASAVAKLVRRGKRPLVVVAHDAGEAQRRRYFGLQPVRGFVAGLVSRDELAVALGRRDLAIVAVSDAGFVAGIDRLGATAVTVDAKSNERPQPSVRKDEDSGARRRGR